MYVLVRGMNLNLRRLSILNSLLDINFRGKDQKLKIHKTTVLFTVISIYSNLSASINHSKKERCGIKQVL